METCEAVRRFEGKRRFRKDYSATQSVQFATLLLFVWEDVNVGSPRTALYRTCMYFNPFASIFMADWSVLCD